MRIALRNFTGEIPKLPAHLLPDTAAQLATNCDFAHGDLRPLKGGLKRATFSNTIKSLFTVDGLRFFSWPRKVTSFRGPVIDDRFSRMYYMDSGKLFVGLISQASANGGEPPTKFRLGVPPAKKAVASVANTASLAGQGALAITASFWYQFNSVRYQEQTVAVTALDALRKFSVEIPALNIDEINKANGTVSESTVQVTSESFEGLETRTVKTITPADIDPAAVDAFIKVTLMIGGSPITQTLKRNGSAANFVFFGSDVEGRFTTEGAANILSFTYGAAASYVFAVTQVNIWGEESEPVLTDTLTFSIDQQVSIAITADRNPEFQSVNTYRIYQSTTNGGGFVGKKEVTSLLAGNDIGVSFSPFEKNDQTLGTLTSTEYFLPPENVEHLALLPNGFFAAAVGNDLYFSEPYRPSAWPYSMNFPHRITGLAVAEQQLLVTTTSFPYLVNGVHPDAVTQQRLPDVQAGFSSQSISYHNGLLAYASRDGLVAIEGARSTLAYSQNLFTREDWRNRYDAVLPVMELATHDGFLVGVNPTNTDGFVLRLDEAGGMYSRLALRADSITVIPLLDAVYYSQGADLFEYAGSTALTAVWQSKDFVLPKHLNFGAGYIRSSGKVKVIILCEDPLTRKMVEHYVVTLDGTQDFRIPSGRRSLRWSVRFETSATVFEYAMAETFRELQSV